MTQPSAARVSIVHLSAIVPPCTSPRAASPPARVLTVLPRAGSGRPSPRSLMPAPASSLPSPAVALPLRASPRLRSGVGGGGAAGPRRLPPPLARAASAGAPASASEMDATAAFGVAYPASAPGTGSRGRGLFHTGADAETPLVTAPLDVVLCVPEAVNPGAEEDSPCAAAVRALYARWKDSTPGGLSPPDAIVDFLVRGEAPKDLRMAVALAWSRRFVPAWRRYAEEVMPAEYESLYLGTEAELEALQDETVRRMAVGSKANYAAGWAFLEEKYPAVLAAMDAENDVATLAPFSRLDLEWARATAHTRAMSGELGGGACAFVVPGVDLANHSFAPNATFGTSENGDAFELRWDVEHSTKKRRKPADPRLGDEILICYGARMPNALLMLHYGFMDPENPNDQLPMECTLPGARRLGSASVADAGRALRDAGDERAEWAARCMFAMADPTCAGGREGDLRCVAAMREAAAEWEKAAATTMAEDEAALEDDALAPRMEMCVRYRLMQKRNVAAFGRFLDAVEREAAEEEDE